MTSNGTIGPLPNRRVAPPTTTDTYAFPSQRRLGRLKCSVSHQSDDHPVFVAVFSGFGLGLSRNYLAAGLLVAGVFIGSALWWLLLSSGVGSFQSRVGSGWMQAINRLSSCIIFTFGIDSLLTSWSR
jgi:hypothetical protein